MEVKIKSAEHSFTVMPKDTNFNINSDSNRNDILFGGKLMYEIDYCGAKLARRLTYKCDIDMVVTASIGCINFKKPSYIGDLIIMTAELKSLGKTSMTFTITVNRESTKGLVEEVCSTEAVFVTIKNGKSTAHNLTF